MVKYIKTIGMLAFFLFGLFSLSFSQETYTITTYYPSPYGVYKELKLYPNTSPSACDSNNEGAMYYDNTSNQIKVCRETAPATYNWEALGGGYWSLSGTNLYPNDTTNWNVGIGTTAPGAKLHVVGNVIASEPTADNHVATKGYVDSHINLEFLAATCNLSTNVEFTELRNKCRDYCSSVYGRAYKTVWCAQQSSITNREYFNWSTCTPSGIVAWGGITSCSTGESKCWCGPPL